MNAWIPLMDYAMKTGVSLSTLRRHIKANKIQYRVENGRYLLLDEELGSRIQSAPMQATSGITENQLLQTKLKKTQTELQQAREEIAELKTLIAFYEDSAASTHARGN